MARQFGGTTYVSVPDRTSLAPDSVANSYACWVYIDSFNGAGDAYISEIFGDYDTVDYSFQFRLGAGTQGAATQKRIGLATGVGGNSATGETWSLTDLTTGVWTHIGAAAVSGDVHFYLNGVLDFSGGAGLTFSDQSNNWVVGRLGGFGRPLNGRLAELGYWSGVTLGADDFKAMAKGAPPSMIRPGHLDLYMPFDDRGDATYTTREWCGGTATLGNGAGSYVPSWGEHPPVLRRRSTRSVFVPAAAASSSLPNFIHHYRQQGIM